MFNWIRLKLIDSTEPLFNVGSTFLSVCHQRAHSLLHFYDSEQGNRVLNGGKFCVFDSLSIVLFYSLAFKQDCNVYRSKHTACLLIVLAFSKTL